MKKYLFMYHFNNAYWSTHVWAENEVEAKEKISAMANAEFVGTSIATIPVPRPPILRTLLDKFLSLFKS